MRIVADENIPCVKEVFGTLGEVTTLPGRKIDDSSLRDAQVLLVRSITDVNRSLLEGSRVRFVGTATIGTDHVDEQYLRSRGIAFASAPGSNANSVAEYVVAALLTVAGNKGFLLRGKTIGVIGVGNCGSRVVKKAEAFGMKVLLNDPPLQRQTNEPKYRPIEELLEADILTLHVPLTNEGIDRTYHLVDGEFLSRLRPECILINTSRGAVVDNRALFSALDSGRIAGAVLDVWENEPNVDLDLLHRVHIGTSHIAGYSLDGKVNATAMLYDAACAFLGVEPKVDVRSFLPKPDVSSIEIRSGANHRASSITQGKARSIAGRGDDEETIAAVVRSVYDIRSDDAALQEIQNVDPGERGAYFDRLRKEYPVRREFHNTEVTLPRPAARSGLAKALAALGFRVKELDADPGEL
jgi:erythronate-4-phosphate dehydrogenase